MPRVDKIRSFTDAVEGGSDCRKDHDWNARPAEQTQAKAETQPSTPITAEASGFVPQLEIYLKEPRYTLNDVTLSSQTRNQIEAVLAEMQHQKLIFDDWGMAEKHQLDRSLSINFSGPPGTGKTITAYAVAHAMGKKILEVPYQLLESKYVGETPKNIASAFEVAKNNDAILFFDEADSFLGKRLDNVSQSTDTAVNLTRSVMIMQLSAFTGVVIFATNLIRNYDPAFISRIRWKIQFHLPDEAERFSIWQSQIPQKLPLNTMVDFASIAQKFDGISGRDIKNAVFRAVIEAAKEKTEDENKRVTQEHLVQAIAEIIESNREFSESSLRIRPVDKELVPPLPPNPSDENTATDASTKSTPRS